MLRIDLPPIRNSAHGEECTLQILGVCNYDPATTVLAHLPDESHGLSKSDDLSGCYACSACHDVIDGRTDWPTEEAGLREWYFRRAQTRTWRRLTEKGVISIKGVKS